MTVEQAEGPIFVVGSSRAGTAVLRSCLNRHRDVHLAGETHYFDDLRVKLAGRERRQLSPEERLRCENYFLALAHRPYGHDGDPASSPLGRAELRSAADRSGDGADAYFEAFCRLEADAHGKSRWGEKTPRHVFRLREIVDRYPGAKVICMVRDPRAVVASYREWRNQGGFDLTADPGHRDALDAERRRTSKSYHVAIASLMWRAAANAAHAGVRELGSQRVIIQRYEDIVTDPDDALGRLTEWLGLDFDAAMLDVPFHNSSFERFDPSAGLSTKPVERWREVLSAGEVDIVQRCAGQTLITSGYSREALSVSTIERARVWASLPLALARAAAANRGRIGNMPGYLWRRLRLLQASS